MYFYSLLVFFSFIFFFFFSYILYILYIIFILYFLLYRFSFVFIGTLLHDDFLGVYTTNNNTI